MKTKTKVVCNLRKRIIQEEVIDETMRVDAIEEDIKMNEACLLLQSVIRGRATQTLVFKSFNNFNLLKYDVDNVS